MSAAFLILLSLCQNQFVISEENYSESDDNYDIVVNDYIEEYNPDYDSYNDVSWESLDSDEFYQSYLQNKSNLYDRETRRNEFVPFNSLTFR